MAKSKKPTSSPVAHMSEDEVNKLCDWLEDNAVHFSFKGVNSNISAGGIRVGLGQSVQDVPYISFRTLLSEGHLFEIDYVCAARFGGPKLKQVSDILGQIKNSDGVNQKNHEEAFRQRYNEIQKTDLLIGALSSVSPRMRQLLLPKGDAYLSVSPLGAAGFNKFIFACRRELNSNIWNAKEEKSRTQEQTYMSKLVHIPAVSSFSVGGSNPQNIGRLISEGFTRPLVFDKVPQISRESKLAFSVYYNGFTPRIKNGVLTKYADFYLTHLLNNQESDVPSYIVAAQEKNILLEIFQDMEKNAAYVLRVLTAHQQSLPDDTLFAEDAFEDNLNAWLTPHLRNDQWKNDQINLIVGSLDGHVMAANQDDGISRLRLSSKDKNRIKKTLQGVLI